MIPQSSQECPLPYDFTLGAENEQAEPSPAEKKIELYRIIIENIDGRLTARINLARIEKPAGSVGPPRAFTMRGIFRAFCLKHLIEADTNTCLRERLAETPQYLGLCDLPRVPSYATLSRGFTALAGVFGEQALLDEVVADLVNELRRLLLEHSFVDGFAIDSTDIEAYERPKSKSNDDDDNDPDSLKPKWGYRTPKGKHQPSNQSRGKKKQGKGASDKGEKPDADKEMYFGHQVQAMCDANLGIPVAFTMMSANKNDNPQFIPLMQKAKRMYKWFSPAYVAADKGYDSAANHKFAYKNGIEAVIPLRKTTATDGMYADVFDKSGALTCDDTTPMTFIRTRIVDGQPRHLFQCSTEGCVLKERGNGAKSYCRFRFWVPVTEENIRAVGGKIARASSEYRRKYKMRPAIERFFSVAKETRLLDTHRYIKPSTVLLHVGLSILTYLATMLAHAQDGRVEDIRRVAIRCE